LTWDAIRQRFFVANDAKRDLPMNVASIVARAQEAYRIYYERCIKAHRTKDSFVCELLILVNGPSEVPERYRLWRCDAIWKQDGKPQPGQFELDPPAPFPPVVEKHESGITVSIHPMVWHRCEFSFGARRPRWKSLDRWQTKWLDQKDKKTPDKSGLAGVIHWLSQPTRNGDRWEFLVDFGSAPPSAFHELLFALSDAGIREVMVGSFGHTA
jgi:hypothetical protein